MPQTRVEFVSRYDEDVTPTCSYCGGTKFYAGPRGGASTNVLCANDKCRHWFNHMPFFGIDDLRKVEPLQRDKIN